MLQIAKPSQVLGRRRQARFRERRRALGKVEIRALVSTEVAAELELAALLMPGVTKDSLVRDTLKAHLPKPLPYSDRLIKLIFENWGRIKAYQNYPPDKLRPGLPSRNHDRLYYYEESVRLLEIKARIEGFLRTHGTAKPDLIASAIYRLAPKSK